MEFPGSGVFRIRVKQGDGFLCHANIGLGFHVSCDDQIAGAIQQRQGEKQPGNVLAGYTAVDGIASDPELSGAADGIRCGTCQSASHPLHFLPQGRKRALGQPPRHDKCGIHAQRPRHRQQKAKGGAAFTAIENGAFRHSCNGKYRVAGVCPGDLRPKGAQAFCRGGDVPVGFGADKLGGFVRESGADQQPVGLGFGGDDGNVPPQASGVNGNIHIKDLPG